MPKVLHQSNPEYSELARSLKFGAEVVLSCVITKEGVASNIKIERPAGLGLDEKAIEAVRTWRFEPAMRNGDPVPVLISVEVEFHLY
jgi:TonB family protein